MQNDPGTPGNAALVLDAPVDDIVDDIDEDMLIEEISIDGMCGVY